MLSVALVAAVGLTVAPPLGLRAAAAVAPARTSIPTAGLFGFLRKKKTGGSAEGSITVGDDFEDPVELVLSGGQRRALSEAAKKRRSGGPNKRARAS